MKKLLLIAVIAVALISSCKREHSASTDPSGKKYKISFNVTNFVQKQSAFALRHNAINLAAGDTLTNLSGYLDVLYYIVYGSDGHAIRMPLMQDSTDCSSMGMITDSLPAGTYQVAIIAGMQGLGINSYGFTASANFGYGGYFWQDTFWDEFTITVSNSSINQDVTLKRVVGKLEVQILDNIPANADSLSVTINPEILSKQVDGGTNNGSTPTSPSTITVAIPASAKGQPNFILDRLVGDTQDLNTVTITCKDAGNNILGTATANNVVFTNNVKTILSGNLFGSSGNSSPQSFTVTVDTAWSSTPSHIGFSLRTHRSSF
jgi:hypothetical protein